MRGGEGEFCRRAGGNTGYDASKIFLKLSRVVDYCFWPASAPKFSKSLSSSSCGYHLGYMSELRVLGSLESKPPPV